MEDGAGSGRGEVEGTGPEVMGPELVRSEESSSVTTSSTSSSSVETVRGGTTVEQRLMVMRHGERVDRIFPSWLRLAKDRTTGRYRPYDLNLPLGIPKRASMAHFHNDSPITELGAATSQMFGRGLRLSVVDVSAIYVSPALRCLQTADHVLRYLKKPKLALKVEPGLFEWLGWYKDGLPTWMSPDELTESEFRLDNTYKPLFSISDLAKIGGAEEVVSYRDRTRGVFQAILARERDTSAILVVAHAPTLDTAGRLILSKGSGLPPPVNEMDKLGLLYPYCSSITLGAVPPAIISGTTPEFAGRSWTLLPSPIPPISYLDFHNRVSNTYFNRP